MTKGPRKRTQEEAANTPQNRMRTELHLSLRLIRTSAILDVSSCYSAGACCPDILAARRGTRFFRVGMSACCSRSRYR
jgi:hypothetical protein